MRIRRFGGPNQNVWLRQQDAFSWLQSLPEESVDMIVTDPPYESLEKHRKTGTTTRLKKSKSSSNEWFSTIPNEKLSELCVLSYRALKMDRHFYIFCDDETSDILKPAGIAAGFKCWKRIVWDKVAIGMGYHYRARYEFILFFEKGKRKLQNLSVPDVLSFKRIKKNGAYPTEKPSDLSEVLVLNSTREGEVVADPFMGSGSTGEAALRNKRRFWGTDIAKESVKRSRSLLGEYNRQAIERK